MNLAPVNATYSMCTIGNSDYTAELFKSSEKEDSHYVVIDCADLSDNILSVYKIFH